MLPMSNPKYCIGKKLTQKRYEIKDMSQQKLGKEAGISQTTISRLESDLQPATDKQILSLSKVLGISPESLKDLPAPNFHIENHNGGYGNNYLVNVNEEVVQLKDEIIRLHEEVVAAKNEIIKANEEALASKDALIEQLKQGDKIQPDTPA